MFIYLYEYYYYVLQYFLFFHLQITVKNHTMVCKACNSCVHNRNDMTLLHLNKCFNGKFNDDHCSIQNYLCYRNRECFMCNGILIISKA